MSAWLQPLSTAANLSLLCVDRFPFVIGRRADCDGCLPFVFVSRRHCQLTRVNAQLVVQDLESFNGTYVNGRRAKVPLPLCNGDELTIGPVSFRVLMPRPDRETCNDLPRAATVADPGTAERPAPAHESS
jgi:pSer/pThr/pTyr-binding forkhead associated (FHA) protein